MSTLSTSVFLSQSTRSTVNSRLLRARRGSELLGRKVDGLLVTFHSTTRSLLAGKSKIIETMREASLSGARIRFFVRDFNELSLQRVQSTARVKVVDVEGQLGGLRVTRVEIREEGPPTLEFAGLAGGGRQIEESRRKYRRAIEELVEIASLQRVFLLLEDTIRKTNRRINALRHFVIPKLETTLARLSHELEEREREEFFRLKKVRNGKRRKIETINETNSVQRRERPRIKAIFEDEDQDLLF